MFDTIETGGSLVMDCGTCPVAGRACEDCAVRVLLDAPVTGLALDPVERRAVDVFVGAGLIGASEAALLTAEVQPWEGVRAAG
ncbi:hypothetical protein [Mobilicoccus pelagius]|uniref:Uncharacterized protein n=1 Tax=Mobilicoccus pelagius NBRC 104925 TaxID=1089455 RepID=H5UUT3_9MICO|nr:hypothetical protein [Mobilicoccus pelagius]GAB49491.1 hypothetical protein MOPEL_130_00980 [Mobilicoccus pelagius NBRC 104925]